MPNNRLREFFWLLLPFALWCFFFKDLLLGKIGLVHDARHFYYLIKYYLDAITQGIYPLWNPFQAWGKPDDFDVRFFGEFNPLFLLIPALNFLKVPYYCAYNMFFAAYWFLSGVGFYALCRRLFGPGLPAYIGYLLFLFSSLGPTVFSDPTIVLVYAPMVWLYFFMVRFHQMRDRRSMLGMAFCLMLLEVTYSMYHFLTVFLCAFLFFCLFYARDLPGIVRHWWGGLWPHKRVLGCCLAGLFMAALPGLLWCLQARHNDLYVMNFTHHGYEMENGGRYKLGSIDLGSSATQVDFDLLFSKLDHFRFKYPLFFYVNVFMAVALLLAFANQISRRTLLWLATALLLFMISLGGVTPVHKFLYRHVPFFQKFRNIYYFLPYAFPFLILLTVDQIEVLLARITASGRRYAWLVWVVGAHVLFYAYLKSLPEVYPAAVWTVVLSSCWWLAAISIYKKPRPQLRVFLFALTVVTLCLQPVQIFGALMSNHGPVPAQYVNQPQKAVFSYERPDRDSEKGLYQEGISYFKKQARDTSGFQDPQLHYLGMKRSFDVNENTTFENFFGYVKHKFWVYSGVSSMKEVTLDDFKNWEPAYADKALVEGNLSGMQRAQLNGAAAVPLSGPSKNFAVQQFHQNAVFLKTNFKEAKFLVYNDSYSPLWKAYLNGRPVNLYRANYAFKGIFLPSGPNQVLFRYGGWGQPAVDYAIGAVFLMMLLALIWV